MALRNWFGDDRLQGVTNHSARSHMAADLHRYLFAASFAKVMGRTTFLGDFPKAILPDHGNVAESLENKKFKDRFRVQLGDRPATTVVSHISKDGHYFIHYDPSQCRSLTVREAARLQTFPDNYHFEGVRTEQYRQVGNAVPPLLARQIAEVVAEVFGRQYERVEW
jgi:DNA (cytosine-5)-methyltransferase 1